MASVVLPVLGLVLIEAALRLIGSGYSTDFFKPMRIGGEDCLVENDQFGFRFFPRDIARMPASLRFPAKKAPGTYRIFILGESAAMGDPEPAFGASRYLEALLQERFPQAKFEVVNAAMTAINSHAILPIAHDCARREGDLWIVYMGNNEMIGPFGVATASGVQTPPSVELVRLTLAIKETRLGQLISDIADKLGRSGANSWGGLQMFARNLVGPDDWRRVRVYRNFERNLRDIVSAGIDSGAHVVLSTVAVNLKDCPPFGSMISSNLSVGDRTQVERLLTEGVSLAGQGNYQEAVRSFEQAAKFRPGSAELEFRLGEALLNLKNQTAARPHFQQACDLDCLTFRANSSINGAILEICRELACPQLTLFDATEVFADDPPDRIPGSEDFCEHVHFTFAGNYRLARGWAELVFGRLPESITKAGASNWVSQSVCERRLGLSDWDRGNVLKEVRTRLQNPPLSSQINNHQRLQALSELDSARRRRMESPDAARKANEVYAEALNKHPDDFYLRQNFGNFLWDRGNLTQAIEQWQKVHELIPQDHAPLYELGRLAATQGRFGDAKSLLDRAVAMRPSFSPGWFELGRVHVAQGDHESATRAYERALVFMPQNAEYWFHSGVALAMLGRRAEAIEHYRQAVRFDPGDWRAHFELGSLLGQDGKMAEAKAESEAAIRLNPNFPAAHLNLGMALVQLGELEEAERQFEETLRLDPTNSRAPDYLTQTRALKTKNR